MADILSVLTPLETAVFTLRGLYSERGYSQYKMSKFEEYELYVKNKDFLVSDNVITFTDTDGRLLALKPDVTLSIIKNSRAGTEGTIKAQYNENVYRVSSGTRSFKEIMQSGIECIGEVGDAEIREVITLALESLNLLSDSSMLLLSSLDIPEGVMKHYGLSEGLRRRILDCLGRKDAGGIRAACLEGGVCDEGIETVTALCTVYGAADAALPTLSRFALNEELCAVIESFTATLLALCDEGYGNRICIDFSLVCDMKYYNGIAMKGFIEGIPMSVLSGGQYDNLMRRMGRREGAIGFAVYLDELWRGEAHK
jgi:ATP phosphoribosyltransferase regulatory subunit